jgi:signal transduction histidine kinase
MPDGLRANLSDYVLGLLIVGAALIARSLMHHWLGAQFPLVTLLGAVALVAWWAGWKPAVLVSLIGFALAQHFFTDPRGPFSSSAVPPTVAAAGYAFLCAAIVGFSVGMRQARLGSQRLVTQLQRDCQSLLAERTAQLNSIQVLQEAQQRKDEFLATLAHELRNPLAPIRNAVHLIRIAGEDPQRVGIACAIIDRQSQQMVRLVNDLLDLSRITRGALELHRETVDLASVIQLAVETARPQIENGKHQLTLDLPERRIPVNVDRGRIAQAIANVLNNSARYSPPAGHIKLSVDADDTNASIVIADHGIGIPKELLDRVFQMYAQARDADAAVQEGLGIGLALVRNIVEMHAGTVTIHSDGRGMGTTVRIELGVVGIAVSG